MDIRGDLLLDWRVSYQCFPCLFGCLLQVRGVNNIGGPGETNGTVNSGLSGVEGPLQEVVDG